MRNQNQPWMYSVQLKKYSRHGSQIYLGIPLIEQIEELGLTEEDKLHMKIGKDQVDENKEIEYIKAVQTHPDADDRNNFSIRKKKDRQFKYLITLPQKFRKQAESPLHNFEVGDDVNIELHTESGQEHIRVYNPDDYPLRMQQVSPKIVSLYFPPSGSDENQEEKPDTVEESKVVDYSLKTHYGGQIFRIFLFDTTINTMISSDFPMQIHYEGEGEIKGTRDPSKPDPIICKRDTFERLKMIFDGDFRRTNPPELTIEWYEETPEMERIKGDRLDDIKTQTWEDNIQGAVSNHLSGRVFRSNVYLTKLPKKGSLRIITAVWRTPNTFLSGSIWMNYVGDSSKRLSNDTKILNGEWEVMYPGEKEGENYYDIYIPLPRIQHLGNEKSIRWAAIHEPM